MNTSTTALVSVALALSTQIPLVQADGADKSGYTLFRPTPRDQMREMSTDRPDQTESAYTVDAGHFQIESDLFAYSRNKDVDPANGVDVRTDSYTVANVNLKAGLLNWMDLQLVVSSYNHVRTHDRVAGTTTRQRGFGEMTTRLKMNLWGNDGGTTAFAAMPYVKFPTDADKLGNGAVEAGLILPLAVELPWGFGMGLMTQLDYVQNAADTDYHVDFVNSITLSHDIYGNLGGYIEFWTVATTDTGGGWEGSFDFGLTYGITEDIQVDVGLNVGVTDNIDDLNPFVGLSWRF